MTVTLEVHFGERRWGVLGACVLKAPHFFSFCNTVLFYEHHDVYCTYSDELIFQRRIMEMNRFCDNYRIVPNRRAVREWKGLGARLLISQVGRMWSLVTPASKLVDN